MRLLVVGDLVLDEYVRGEVERVSPEAPVPVVQVLDEHLVLGGAGNVVRNVVALGGGVSFCSVVGDDLAGGQAADLLKNLGVDPAGLVVAEGRPTTRKTRVVARNQQIVRFDRETVEPPAPGVGSELLQSVERALGACDGVVVEDYGKGVLEGEFGAAVMERCVERSIPVVVDPKSSLEPWRGASVVKPNLKEAEWLTGVRVRNGGDLARAAALLRESPGRRRRRGHPGWRGHVDLRGRRPRRRRPHCGAGRLRRPGRRRHDHRGPGAGPARGRHAARGGGAGQRGGGASWSARWARPRPAPPKFAISCPRPLTPPERRPDEPFARSTAMRSMTGFGRASFELDELPCDVEVRSVNHRYLDVRGAACRACSPRFEGEVRVAHPVALRTGQGRSLGDGAPGGAAVNSPRLEVDRRGRPRVPGGSPEELSEGEGVVRERSMWERCSRCPAFRRLAEPEVSAEKLRGGALRRGGCGPRGAGRRCAWPKEAALRARSARAHGATSNAAGRVCSRTRAGVVQEAVRERLRRRAEPAANRRRGLLDEARLHQEIVIAADRLDVTEEIVRLRSHAQQFRRIVEESGPGKPVGRRLDFLLQEFGRETNTIGSKGCDAPIAYEIVELKTEIERLREQVQNVE